MADFTFTSTADFDGGSKSSTETVTDNYLIVANAIGLAPLVCDRISGGARKSGWTVDVSGSNTIVDDTDNLYFSTDRYKYMHLQRSNGSDNVTIIAKINIMVNLIGNSWFPLVALYWDRDNWWGCGLGADAGTANPKHECNHVVAGAWATTITGTPSYSTYYYYKVELSAGDVKGYYSSDGSSWTLIQAWGSRPTGFAGAPAFIIYGSGVSLLPTYTGYTLNSDAGSSTSYEWRMSDLTLLPYNTTGDWTSSSVSMVGKRLYKIDLTVSSADANNYIDKVEVLRASDNAVLSTYSGNITSSGTTSLYSANFDNGFDCTYDVNVKIKVYFVGDSSAAVILEALDGWVSGPGGFVITTTADFDSGSKSNTETNTDNYLIVSDAIGNAPLLCDRVSGGSRIAGWTDDKYSTSTITDNTGYVRVYSDKYWYCHFQRTWATDNVTIIGRMKTDVSVGNSWLPQVCLYWDTSNYYGAGIGTNGGLKHENVRNIAGAFSGTMTGSPSTGVWYYYKVVLDASNITSYYGTDGSSWTQIDTRARPAGFSGAPTYIIYGMGVTLLPTYPTAHLNNIAGTLGSSCNVDFTNMTVLPYNLSGDWKSASQTMPAGAKLKQLSIVTSGCAGTKYVDKVEVLKASDDSVLTTYSGNITTDTTTVLTGSDFDNGLAVTANLNIKVKVYLVGEAAATPLVEEITGEFEYLSSAGSSMMSKMIALEVM
jgi:hypothetical protein